MTSRRIDWWLAGAIAAYTVNLVGWVVFVFIKVLESSNV